MLSFLKKDKNKNSEKKPRWIPIVILAIGIALMLFGSTVQSKDAATEASDTTVKDELTRYQEYLEERVQSLCRSMGLGETTAIVTLESGFEEVYASELRDGNEEYVIIGSGSGAHPLLLYSNAPEIMGIGVVFKSPLSIDRQNELLELLSTTFHTPTNRIYITHAK